MAKVHLGKLVEDKLDEIGMSKTEFGRRIHRSPQSVRSLLERESFGVDILEEMCDAIDYDFFALLTRGAKDFTTDPRQMSPVSLTFNVTPDRVPNLLIAAFGEENARAMLTNFMPPKDTVQPGLQPNEA